MRLAQQCNDMLQNSTLAPAAPSRPVPAQPRGPYGPHRLPLTKESGSTPSIPHLITQSCTRMGTSEDVVTPPTTRPGSDEAWWSRACRRLTWASPAASFPGQELQPTVRENKAPSGGARPALAASKLASPPCFWARPPPSIHQWYGRSRAPSRKSQKGGRA